MQVTPDYSHPRHPPPPPTNSTINRTPLLQPLTPDCSVTDEDLSTSTTASSSAATSAGPARDHDRRPRSLSDPREDDYYFYHIGKKGSGGMMTSRRSSVHSLGRPSEDAAQSTKAPEQVRLPPISSLLAAVESTPTPPQPPPPQQQQQYHQQQYPTPRERQTPQFSSSREIPQQYYSPYPHMPYRRQSIFSAYASTPSSSPQNPSYPPSSHHLHPPHQTGLTPYRTPSPPYPQSHHRPPPPQQQQQQQQQQQRHVSIPQNYPSTYIQPRLHSQPLNMPTGSLGRSAPPAFAINPTFALTHRTNSASPAERYLCHECNKSFSRPSSLRIHTFSHTGEKPFVCPEPGCTKRFSVRSNMRRHMKVHNDPVRERSTTEEYDARARERSATIDVERIPPVRQAHSAKDDDEGVSEASEISPGGPLGGRPRQGSRSSI